MKKALIVLMAFLILSPSVIFANSTAEKPRLRIEPFVLWGYNDSDMETIVTMLSMQDSLRMAYNIVADDAEYVLVTDVGRLGDATVLMMRILNVTDSSQIADSNLSFHAIAEIVEQIPQVAARLAAPVLARLPAPSSVVATSAAAPSTVDNNDDGDISPASIAQLVGDLVRNTVGGRFGETVGNAVANIVVEQVRTRLNQIGISADNDVGQIVGDIVAQTVSQEVAKNVPGPAGRMGGERVGKAVGETVARQVNNLIAGLPLDDGMAEGGGRREGSGRTRMGVKIAFNLSYADIDVYSSDGKIDNHLGPGFEVGFVLNTQLSQRWFLVYGADFIFRTPVYDEDNKKSVVTETAVAIPALFRFGGTNDFPAFVENGFQLDITGGGDEFERNTPGVGYVFGIGVCLGCRVELGQRLYIGMRDFTSTQSGMFIQTNFNLTIMFGRR